jgi:hypothetical protein
MTSPSSEAGFRNTHESGFSVGTNIGFGLGKWGKYQGLWLRDSDNLFEATFLNWCNRGNLIILVWI